MKQQSAKSVRSRAAGPVAGLALAVFTALTFGVAQSQIAVDAAPWAEAVLEAAREVILPTPPRPVAPANMPVAPRPRFTPGDDLRRIPALDLKETPKIPDSVEPVPMTPWGPLPTRERRTGSADAAQMCAAGCQETIDAGLAACGGYAAEATLGRAVVYDPGCRQKLREPYLNCMASCGFDRLPIALPGRRIPGDLGSIRQDLTP
jgi:hypothetical protein